MKRIVIALIVMACVSAAYADEVLFKANAEEGGQENLKGVTEVYNDSKEGNRSYLKKGMGRIVGTTKLTINPEKFYKVTARVKSLSKEPSYAYLGYIPYDKDGITIAPESVNMVPATQGRLAEACTAESKVLKVIGGSAWKKGPNFLAAFEVKSDLSDLPNRNLSTRGVTGVALQKGYVEMTFAKPIGKSYPAGTEVRQHYISATYVYAKRAKVTSEWNTWKGAVFKGSALRRGVASVEFILLANYGQSYKDKSMLVDDIVVEEFDTMEAASGE
jgi:hypothetical protein